LRPLWESLESALPHTIYFGQEEGRGRRKGMALKERVRERGRMKVVSIAVFGEWECVQCTGDGD